MCVCIGAIICFTFRGTTTCSAHVDIHANAVFYCVRIRDECQYAWRCRGTVHHFESGNPRRRSKHHCLRCGFCPCCQYPTAEHPGSGYVAVQNFQETTTVSTILVIRCFCLFQCKDCERSRMTTQFKRQMYPFKLECRGLRLGQ